MNRRSLRSAAALLLLCGCVNELPTINDRIDGSARVVRIQPRTTAAESAVEVSVEGTLSFSGMSWLDTQNVADVKLGVCFVREVTDERLLDPQGLCGRSSSLLSGRYRLLDGTSYFKSVGNIVVQRGVASTFAHSFKFTMDVPDDVFLNAVVVFQPEDYNEPDTGGSEGHESIIFTP